MRHRQIVQFGAAIVLLLSTLSELAHAQGVPSPANCTIPECFALVGVTWYNGASPSGLFSITIRDIADNPLPGVTVKLDFSSVSDAAFTVQGGIMNDVDCQARWVRTRTEFDGEAWFQLIGRATGVSSPGISGCMVRVYAGTELIGQTLVTAYEFDEVPGLGAGDLSYWLEQSMLDGSLVGDYDCSGSYSAADLSRWLTAFTSGEFVSTRGLLCR